MATLSFTQTAEGYWSASATVNGDFALHLERAASGTISINISSVAGAADQEKYITQSGFVYDQDFQALVYPKYVRIVSESQPISGSCFILDGTEETSDTTETTETTEENNEVEGEGE